jgi:large subunit ribosomal protein L17
MLANLVCSLIKQKRIQTTLAKARAARSVAEKMVTLAKKGGIHHRRLAAARLHQEDAVKILFAEIGPTQKTRPGGYTRIIKLNQRQGDAASLAILEWVDLTGAEVVTAQPKSEPKVEKSEPKVEKSEPKAEAKPEETTAPENK